MKHALALVETLSDALPVSALPGHLDRLAAALRTTSANARALHARVSWSTRPHARAAVLRSNLANRRGCKENVKIRPFCLTFPDHHAKLYMSAGDPPASNL